MLQLNRAGTIFLFILLIFPTMSYAGEIEKNEITYEDGIYKNDTRATIAVPYKKVYRILTDYNHLTDVNPAIIKSKVIREKGDYTRMSTVSRNCVLFFCVQIKNTQDVYDKGNGHIIARTISSESDLSYGKMDWHIHKLDKKHTKVSMQGEFKPAFFVPPLIGPLLIKIRVKEEVEASIEAIEKLAEKN